MSNRHVKMNDLSQAGHEPALEPCVEMEEHPQPHSIRFRYASEGNSHGGLQGISSQRGNKTYPTIVIRNHHGPVKIVVELIAKDVRQNIHPHAHELIGKGCEHGVYSWKHMVDSPHCQIVFRHLSVQHVTKKILVQTLQRRLLMQRNKFPLKYEPTADEMEAVRQEAVDLSKKLPMNSARLCFRVFTLNESDRVIRELEPAISEPIFDAKSPSAALLKICRIDRHAGSCLGGDEVFLLCDRVQKGDIEVEFYEVDDIDVTWSSYATFTANDIHRQFAIVFTTPAYRDPGIERPVDVFIRLYRPSDQEMSEPVKFTYRPNMERDELDRKRRKTLNFQLPDEIDDIGASRGTMSAQSALNLPAGFFSSSGDTKDVDVSRLDRKLSPTDVRKRRDVTLSESDLIKNGIDAMETSKTDVNLTITDLLHQLHPLPRDISEIGQESPVESDTYITSGPAMTKVLADNPSTPKPKRKTSGTDHQDTDTKGGKSSDLDYAKCDQKAESMDSSEVEQKLKLAMLHYGSSGTVRTLLYDLHEYMDTHNDHGDSPLGLSIILCRTEAAINMTEVAAAHASHLLHATNNLGQTILHLCVQHQRHTILRYLLGVRVHPGNPHRVRDLPVNVRDQSGNTFLHMAVSRVDHAVVRSLRSYVRLMRKHREEYDDSWLNMLNRDGFSALHLAVKSGDVDLLDLLYQLGVDVNVRSSLGRTPLHQAIIDGHIHVLGSLMEQPNLELSAKCDDGLTPLHYAVWYNLSAEVNLLVTAGADKQIRAPSPDEQNKKAANVQKFTPAQLAHLGGHTQMLQILGGDELEQAEEDLETVIDRGDRQTENEIEGDLERLSYPLRHQLSAMMLTSAGDVMSSSVEDWPRLAEKLGRKDLIPLLQVLQDPVVALLDNYEMSNGTLAELYKAVLSMDRFDLAHILANNFPEL